MLPKRLLQLEELVLTGNQPAWQAAMQELAEFRHANAVTLLHTAISDVNGERSARARTCFQHAVCNHPDIALRHSSYEIREASLLAAGQCREGRVISEVSRILRNESNEAMRQLAAGILGEINQEACIEALQHTQSDRSEKVRRAGLQALKTITHSAAERAVVEFLDDTDWSIREVAFEYLSNTGWVPRSDRHRVLHAVMRGRFDEAIRYGEKAVETLVGAALCLGNSEVRQWAAINLARIRTRRVIEGLRAGLSSPHPEVRQAAAAALETVGNVPPTPRTPAASAPTAALPKPRHREPDRAFEAACSLIAQAFEL